eukprot:scaffold2677_cov220-Pinguiococcus_pyrenoidosus.AAC.13
MIRVSKNKRKRRIADAAFVGKNGRRGRTVPRRIPSSRCAAPPSVYALLLYQAIRQGISAQAVRHVFMSRDQPRELLVSFGRGPDCTQQTPLTVGRREHRCRLFVGVLRVKDAGRKALNKKRHRLGEQAP